MVSKQTWILRVIEITILLAQIVVLGIYVRQALTTGGGLDRAMLVQVVFPTTILPALAVLAALFSASQYFFRDRIGMLVGAVEVLLLIGAYLVSLDLHAARILAFSLMVASLAAGTAFILLVRASVR